MPYILFTGLGPGQMTKNILNYINKIKDFRKLSIAVFWKDKSDNETIDWFQGQTYFVWVNFDQKFRIV